MDTRLDRSQSQESAFPAKNRTESASTPSAATADPAGPVTVGRSDGVVPPSTGHLFYEVDPVGHRIVARYASGDIAFAFGGFGRAAGQFDTPLHVVTVSPEFLGEPQGRSGIPNLLTPWLAVADYGNHRVQFFECDGAFLGETDLDPATPPCHLTWRSPALEVSTVEGRLVRVHVAAALLSSSSRHPDMRRERNTHTDPRRVWRVC